MGLVVFPLMWLFLRDRWGLTQIVFDPSTSAQMHDAAHAGFVNEAYLLLIQNQAWAGGQYYDESWIMMTVLMMTGNFLDYTQYD